jgi:hypothetical protein
MVLNVGGNVRIGSENGVYGGSAVIQKVVNGSAATLLTLINQGQNAQSNTRLAFQGFTTNTSGPKN